MNANELNRWIENSPYTEQEEVIVLLLKQQAEIEALKAEIVSIEKNTDYWADKANWIKNNEPVAWMSKEDFEDYLSEDKRVTSATVFNFKLDIPLYTHPVKELTDEEIMEVFKGVNLFTTNMVDVARAILRKAQSND